MQKMNVLMNRSTQRTEISVRNMRRSKDRGNEDRTMTTLTLENYISSNVDRAQKSKDRK